MITTSEVKSLIADVVRDRRGLVAGGYPSDGPQVALYRRIEEALAQAAGGQIVDVGDGLAAVVLCPRSLTGKNGSGDSFCTLPQEHPSDCAWSAPVASNKPSLRAYCERHYGPVAERVWTNHFVSDTWEYVVGILGAEIDRLKRVVDRDRRASSRWIGAVRATMERYAWIAEGRGAYAWDDDRYRKEFAAAMNALKARLDEAAADTRAYDWADSLQDVSPSGVAGR
jgi:hypothetical protein